MKKLLYILLLLPALVRGQVIITVAGGGTGGNGIPATASGLSEPYGINLDDTGNLYICDLGHAQLRKVSPAYPGYISVVAGNGVVGYSGDGGPAGDASLRTVYDVAIDKRGNIYISDPDDNRIRKITKDGIIHTLAGIGIAGYNGDGIPATMAKLNTPRGIATDDTGNVYVADRGNFRIRKIDTFGTITTIAGTGEQGFSQDGSSVDTARLDSLIGLRVDSKGYIYMYDNCRFRKIDADNTVTTIAGTGIIGYSGDGGPATAAMVWGGVMTVDTSGNLYIADGVSSRIRKVNKFGIINTIAGTGFGGFSGDWGNPLLAQIKGSIGIATNTDGDVFFTDQGNYRIRMITNKEVRVDELYETPFELEIVPNPAPDMCRILVNSPTEETLIISLTDLDGKERLQLYGFTNCPMELPTRLPRGIYIVTAIAGNRKATKKLIIE